MQWVRLIFSVVIALEATGATADEPSPRFSKSIPVSSVLAGAQKLHLYDQDFIKLSRQDRTVVQTYGLRLVPLHPMVWGIRINELTNSKSLIPMRTYFLRSSESAGYHLESVVLSMKFAGAKKGQMLSAPFTHTPVMEIGFGGRYLPRVAGGRPKADSQYYLRISAHPKLPSGLFYRSFSRSVQLSDVSGYKIKPGKSYKVRLVTQDGRVQAWLNEELFASFTLESFHSSGLVSLVTDWHPVSITELTINGKLNDLPLEDSGLVEVSTND